MTFTAITALGGFPPSQIRLYFLELTTFANGSIDLRMLMKINKI